MDSKCPSLPDTTIVYKLLLEQAVVSINLAVLYEVRILNPKL